MFLWSLVCFHLRFQHGPIIVLESQTPIVPHFVLNVFPHMPLNIPAVTGVNCLTMGDKFNSTLQMSMETTGMLFVSLLTWCAFFDLRDCGLFGCKTAVWSLGWSRRHNSCHPWCSSIWFLGHPGPIERDLANSYVILLLLGSQKKSQTGMHQ